MRSIKAIFSKQLLDLFKNRIMLIQFLVFPIVAFVFTEVVAKSNDDLPDSMFVTLFACIYAGITVLTTTASFIAEDRERKSLRFLVMAGVKPYQYLLGIGGVMMIASLLVSTVFGLMGGFQGLEFLQFTSALMLGTIASILLGAAIGIISKNQQAATAVAMTIGMVLGFTPMLAMFSDSVKKLFGFFYTLQVDTLVSDFSAGFSKPMMIILANVAVLLVLFVAAYKKKGLRV